MSFFLSGHIERNMSRIAIYLVFSFSVVMDNLAQDDSVRTYALEGILVEGEILRESEIGLTRVDLSAAQDAAGDGLSFSELLRASGAAPIRSYGASGLSTPSFRGTGSSHTAILWNGVSIQSPMSGQQDLSLIQSGLFNDLSILKGGASSLYGTGAIGGVINLNSTLELNEGLELSGVQKAGSFSHFFQQYSASWSGKKFFTKTTYFRRFLENDFEYVNAFVRPEVSETLENAGIQRQGIYHEDQFQLNPQNALKAAVWWQSNFLEIPAPIFSSPSEATQADDFVRAFLSWTNSGVRHKISVIQSLQHQDLLYLDPTVNLASNSSFNNWVSRVTTEYRISSALTVVGGVNHLTESAQADNFIGSGPKRNTTSLFSSLRWFSGENFSLAFSAREEFIDGSLTPFAPSLGGSYEVHEGVVFNFNASKNYRVPTFNDLYWRGAGAEGNNQLKPESSLNSEIGFVFKRGENNKAFEVALNAYTGEIDNWILWSANTTNVWSPENLKQVWNRGLESTVNFNRRFGQLDLSIRAGYERTKTTASEIYGDTPESEKGKQLVYTPIHQGHFQLSSSVGKWTCNINSTWVGQQFTDAGNSELFSISNFQVVNAFLSYEASLKSFRGGLRFDINNMLNMDYQNRRGYPMYGRNYSLTLTINYTKSDET